MLFKVKEQVYTFMPAGSGSLKDVAINNFYYYTQEIISYYGAGAALAALAGLLVVMTALKTGVTYLAMYVVVPMRNGIVRDIRNTMFNKMVSLPMGFFTSERKGDIMARMSGDVAEIENSIMSSLDMIFKNPVMILVCLGTMIAISWQLTLFVMVLLPMAGLVMGRVGKALKRKSLEQQNRWGGLMSNIEECLGGLRIIKAFNAEDKVRGRFKAENEVYFRLSNRITRRQNLAHPMSEFLGTTAIAIVLWFGGSLILTGASSMNAAAFIYYMVIFYSIINPAKDLSKAMYSIQKGLAAMVRVDKILSAENPITDPAEPRKIADLKGNITYTEPVSKFAQVSAQYRASYEYQERDKRSYITGDDFDPTGITPAPELSNSYRSGYMIHRAGPGFRYAKERNTLVANVYYQHSSLDGQVERANSEKISHGYDDITYFLMGQFNINRENSIRLFVRSYTQNPSITDLQSVYDVSDAQYISSGNPELNPSYSHNVMFHYINSNLEKGRTFMWMFSLQNTSDYITPDVAYNGSVQIDGTQYNYLQYSRPVNMDGYCRCART